ncbi:MAG: DUF881 domain-containing protein [Armatimonadota bacterium]
MRNDSWITKITIMSVILGMLLAVSLKTQQQVGVENNVPTNLREMVAVIRDTKQQNKMLKDQVELLQEKITAYEKQAGNGSPAVAALIKELHDSKFRAGLTTAEGAGIVLQLKDSPGKPSTETAPIDLIIHDSDIRNFINELVNAGAEAISVNDQRVTSRSAIRCAGNNIQINNWPLVAPYEIKAIGDPKTLEGALRMPQGIVDSFPDPKMVTIKQENHITIKPAELTSYRWAKPLESGR